MVPSNTPSPLREAHRHQLKSLLWPLLLAMLAGLGALGEPLEDTLRVMRNKAHPSAATGDIVIVQVGPESLRAIGDWPWPRATQAKVFERLAEYGAKTVVADIMYIGPTNRANDQALGNAIGKAGNVVVAASTRVGMGNGRQEKGEVLGTVRRNARSIATLSFEHNWQNAVWNLPRAHRVDGKIVPSLAWVLAGRPVGPTGTFAVDYSIDPTTVPIVRAVDLIERRVPRSVLEGKTVAFGTNSFIIGDQYTIPGYGRMGGVFIHVLGAETLKRGDPRSIGWIPGLLVALAACLLAVRRERIRYLGAGAAALLTVPILLEANLVFGDVVPGLVMIGVLAARMTWAVARARGLHNALTGLPNLAALNAVRDGRDKPLVAVRVHNYAAIVSTLDSESEAKFVDQVVQRLTLGNRERTVYQGDEGIFAWFADPGTPFAQHLEALHTLFRSPIRIQNGAYDVALSFGVELGSSRSMSSRLGSALVAAQEADAEALKWKFHDPARHEEVPWKLSLLSQLDEAIENGEVWIAYQPKVDLATRQTIGAEALARWTHPEKGPITPSEFISAAEQSDRIQRLTDFVLQESIRVAAEINRQGHAFEIAVNLSARMLTDRHLPERVAAYLARYNLRADRLILELTETAAVAGSGSGIDLLVRMRDLGVRIAIDDYGTGLSTLDYLKKVPASELKIDQSFIKAMRDNRSDLIMVQSTITLAHSLGRTVVAEGVEDPGSLDQLSKMGCDQAQGFIVGRPMKSDELRRRLSVEKRRSAAA